ncbi:MAG TPA: hypothetical protein VMY18_05755, partial [Acidobacteriota bacterium]|nr:hypothetical protein [Acidobacteriota bacterium]
MGRQENPVCRKNALLDLHQRLLLADRLRVTSLNGEKQVDLKPDTRSGTTNSLRCVSLLGPLFQNQLVRDVV